MKIIFTSFFLTGFFALLSCKNQKNATDLKSDFNNRKALFEGIVSTLRNDNKLDSLISAGDFLNGKMKYSAPAFYDSLRDIGITEVISFWGAGCKKIRQYDFKTNWTNEFPIHFNFNSCDSEARFGFYRKDENSNEFWGLGNNWKMWREVKLLDVKQ